jgi:ABC-type dipeptide/oligopeptide/nickel transport system permease component
MSSVRLVVRRLLLTLVVLWGVTTVTFVVMNILPRDTAAAMGGPLSTPEQLAKFRHDWGLDRPLPEQYLTFYKHLFRGDLGKSIRTQRPVLQEMVDFFPATAELGIFGLLFGLLMGIPLGVFSALYRGRWFDNFARVFAVTGVSIPNFWLGLLLLYFFYYKVNLFPPGHLSLSITLPRVTGLILLDSLIAGDGHAFLDGLRHIVMPAFVVAISLTGYISRQVRTSMIEVLGSEYIRAGRARGLSSRTLLLRHALKNALIPTVSILGVLVGRLFSGSMVSEIVFAWPGMGYNAYQSILKADQPMVLGFTFCVAIIYTVSTMAVDVLYGYLNPRIREANA